MAVVQNLGSRVLEGHHDTEYVQQDKNAFQIEVSDPIKQGEGVAAYVVYKVKTSTGENSSLKPSEVARRFRDFSCLYDKLVEKNKGLIIPALPEKNAVQKFSMSTDFIEQRRKALQTFINKVASHPVLKDALELRMFLKAEDDDWTLEIARWQAETSAYNNHVTGAVFWLKSLQHTAQTLVTGKSDEIQEDAEYLKVRDYISNLEVHLSEAHRQASRLVQREQELGQSMAEFGDAADALGKFDEGSLRTTLSQLQQRARQLGDQSRRRAESLAAHFEAPLKEMSRTLRSAKAAMAGRANALSLYSLAKSELDSKRVRLARLRGTPGTREEKLAEADREANEADQRLRNAKLGYDQIREQMREELSRFQRERAVELAQILRDFAAAQARHAAEQADAWYSFLEGIN